MSQPIRAVRLSQPRNSLMFVALTEKSMRAKYTLWAIKITDPLQADYFFDKFLHAWYMDPAMYVYWFCSFAGLTFAFGYMFRKFLFDPHMYFKKSEHRRPLPDRHRQWTYSLPYYNHHLRNLASMHRWCLIDNEPDCCNEHPLGIRPNRVTAPERHFWAFTVPRYHVDDPNFERNSFKSMEKMYRDMGYYKCRETEEEEDDD